MSSSEQPQTLPKFHLELLDCSHTGTQIFLCMCREDAQVLQRCYRKAHHLLYGILSDIHQPCYWHGVTPRSVKLIVRPMEGIAYTTGNAIDDEHKEIHLNANYIEAQTRKITKRKSHAPMPTATVTHRTAAVMTQDENVNLGSVFDEIKGVIVHEMVHTMQFSAQGSCPGGLVEGIADWVRLQAGLVPPHWDRGDRGDRQNMYYGYQVTGTWQQDCMCVGAQSHSLCPSAFFLEWLSQRTNEVNLVPKLNLALAQYHWKDGDVLQKVLYSLHVRSSVKDLWKEYCQ